MAYNSYPIIMNGEAIPFPDSWDENPKKISNTFETEAGTIRKIITRSSRMGISASFTVTDRWLKKFKALRNLSGFAVRVFDATANGYQQINMFIDDDSFQYSLITASRYENGTTGLYKLSFDLEEF